MADRPKHKRAVRRDVVDVVDELFARGLLKVLEAACGHHGVYPSAVLGRPKTKAIAAARRELVWRLYAEESIASPELGTLLGLDRSTVLHHVRVYQQRSAVGWRTSRKEAAE